MAKRYAGKNSNSRLYDWLQVIEEMEELKEEVDEARKLAEEWEAKYKEMQRQMSLLEEGTPFAKKNSTAGFEKPVLQRGLSTTSSGIHTWLDINLSKVKDTRYSDDLSIHISR